ncbi:MAG: hypothetical protein JXA97_03335 [Anaerolineales bacterium]|nr:hypothetical protein [Anaerolineales bacterium]
METLEKRQMRFLTIRLVTLASVLLLALSACSSIPAAITEPAPLVTAPATPSPLPSIAAPTALSPLPEPTATPQLSRTGPWWIAHASEHIWIMNPDGTSLTTLTFPAENRFYPGNLTAAPDGRHLAFLAGYQLAEGISLYIVDLPGGTYQKIDVMQPFTDFSIDDFYPGTASYDMGQANTAINHGTSLAWSPDSSQLAFLGWIGGSSVDLYLYDLASGEITQLTDGPSQAYQVYWSPNGRYLLHAGVDSFGTGAGYAMAGLWVVDFPQDVMYEVDIGMLRGDFIFHGWLDDETFLAASFSAVCGEFNLRAVNLRTGRVAAIWPGSYGAFDIDPITWTMLLDAPEYAVGDPLCNEQALAGLVLVDENTEARLMGSRIASRIHWSEALGAFIFEQGERITVLSRDGITLEDLPAFPCLLPNGVDWAFETEQSPGLWVGSAGTLPETGVVDCDDPDWAWNPDGSIFTYIHNDNLHIAQAPDFLSLLVVEDLSPVPAGLLWAGGD